MRTPWFMHQHAGKNTLTGVYPTPIGAFVRSCENGVVEIFFYPMDRSFLAGSRRISTFIGLFDCFSDNVEEQIDVAIETHLGKNYIRED